MAIQRFKRDRPTIGVLAGWSTLEGTTPDHYRASIERGIQSAAANRKCNLFTSWGTRRIYGMNRAHPAWPVVSPEADFVPVGPWNTDGLIVFTPILEKSQSTYLQNLISEGFPVLFIATGENGPTISVNNHMGINQAVGHLAAHGHRRIAFLAGMPNDMGDSKARLDAYRAAVYKHNLEDDPNLIAWGWHDMLQAHQATQQLLQSKLKFTAIMASNDNSAIGAMQAIHEAGLQIPQDIAIIGFDDHPGAIAQVPPLTSVHVPLKLIGEQAVLMMDDHLKGLGPLESLQIPTRLTQRQSCGCMPSIVTTTLIGSSFEYTSNGNKATEKSVEEVYQQLVDVMLKALPAEQRYPDEAELRQICTVLVEAFFTGLLQDDPAYFKVAITESIQKMEITDSNIDYWQEMISLLRHEMSRLPVPWDQKRTRSLAEDMLHLARAVISESAQRGNHRHKYQRDLAEQNLNSVVTQLSGKLTEEEIVELLNTRLAEIGIRHADLFSFRPEEEDQVAWSYAIGQKDKIADQRFPSREFPPPGLYPTDEILNLVFLPLVFQGEVLGYGVFDASDLRACALVAKQLAVSIKVSQLHAQVVELSLTDSLTGLHNRRYFDLILTSEIARGRRFQHELSIIMLDIDHFKEYNDQYGHLAGDQALHEIANCLVKERRKLDVITRIGGEEFAIILPETDRKGAEICAEKIRVSVAEISDLKCSVTISLGVATLTNEIYKPDAFLQRADQALYEAKRGGRNQVRVYQEEIRTHPPTDLI